MREACARAFDWSIPPLDGHTPNATVADRIQSYLSPAHRDLVSAHQAVASRFFVAPNGVAARSELDGVPVRRPVGAVPRLVMLSRIVEHKNPHLLVAALAGLTEFAWELDIFGDGPDRERLEALTPPELAGRVRWRGWSPGPEQALADADLVCVPSGSEAFPMVIPTSSIEIARPSDAAAITPVTTASTAAQPVANSTASSGVNPQTLAECAAA